MKDIICVTVAKDHTFECACDIIGRAGESETARLEITVPHSFTNWWTYIEFRKPNGELCRTPNLEVADGVANYDIPLHLLTESGEMEVQLVFQKESGEIWKSSKKKYIITESLNATDDIPEKEDFITEAQAVLDELSGEVQEIADALANDPDFANVVIQACGGQTKINTINGTPLRFFVGTQAEYEALTEAQKKNLFAVITNDTTKDAIFSAINALQSEITGIQGDINGIREGTITAKNADEARLANYAGILVPDNLPDTESSSENDFISISTTGIYVIDIFSDSEDDNYYTAVIIIPDISRKARSTIAKDINRNVSCQAVYIPQHSTGEGGATNVLQIEHDADYDYVYKIARCVRIANIY